jgi:hypothetical protein
VVAQVVTPAVVSRREALEQERAMLVVVWRQVAHEQEIEVEPRLWCPARAHWLWKLALC